jgi:hypothetical protein
LPAWAVASSPVKHPTLLAAFINRYVESGFIFNPSPNTNRFVNRFITIELENE